MSSRFIHVVPNGGTTFLNKEYDIVEWYSIVYMYNIFFTDSSIDRHYGCFQVLAIVNSAAMNMRMQITLWDSDFISFVYIRRSGIAFTAWLAHHCVAAISAWLTQWAIDRYIFKCLCIYLAALDLSWVIRGLQSSLWHASSFSATCGSSSLTRDQTWASCVGIRVLATAEESPGKPCCRSVGHKCLDLFVGSLFCSVGLYVFLCQYHTYCLITLA